jgi:hypothetical protein
MGGWVIRAIHRDERVLGGRSEKEEVGMIWDGQDDVEVESDG